jgi:hypothetical protein
MRLKGKVLTVRRAWQSGFQQGFSEIRFVEKLRTAEDNWGGR